MEYHKTNPNFALIVYSALQHQQLGKHIHFHKYFRRNPKAQQVQSNHEKIKYLSMRTNWTMKLSQQMVMSNPKLRKNENNTAACVSFKKNKWYNNKTNIKKYYIFKIVSRVYLHGTFSPCADLTIRFDVMRWNILKNNQNCYRYFSNRVSSFHSALKRGKYCQEILAQFIY